MSGLTRPAFVLLLLLLSLAAGAKWLPAQDEEATPVKLSLGVVSVRPGENGDARLQFAGGSLQRQTADIEFELPSTADQRWVLWLPRDPFDLVRMTNSDGSARTRNFFRPAADAGLLPVGYAFPLNREAKGEQRLRLELRGAVRSAPAVRIMSEQDVLREVSREFALSCGIYAALGTLLIAALALYPAVRDPMFLLYSAYLATALLFVATVNGHMYVLPGAQILGALGARGYWLMMLVFNAVALLTLTRFVDTRSSRSSWIRGLDKLVIPMALLVVIPLLPFQAAGDSLQAITTVAWIVAMLAVIVAMIDGARRRAQMAVALAVAMTLLVLAAGAHEGMQRAWLVDDMLTRHGYQFALVLVSVIMFVGLGSRIGLVRQLLDDETSARVQSEIRLRQERTRSGFTLDLQDRLRSVAEDEIALTAFRLLAEHARELTGAAAATVVGGGYLGHDLLLVQPDGQAVGFAQEMLVARGIMRKHALNREPTHVRLDGVRQTDAVDKPLRAIIPMRLASPAWAALVVPASGPQGLDQGVLAALTELARLTVLHADEAYAAIQLKRTAEHDSLTGTQNRRSLDQALVREFKAGGLSGSALAVLFIDIDWFKRINDRLGHACGDLCIRSIAASLRGELRPTDALGRYGGDEFLVLLPGHDAAAARIIAERLRRVVEDSVVYWQGEALPLTVSIGMAARRETDHDPATLLERADKALYAAKHEGRNRVCAAPAVFS